MDPWGCVSEARPLPVLTCGMESPISGFQSKGIGGVGLRAESKRGRERERRRWMGKRGEEGKPLFVQNVKSVGSSCVGAGDQRLAPSPTS